MMRTKATILSFFIVFAAYLVYGWALVPFVLPNLNAERSTEFVDTGKSKIPDELVPFLPLFPKDGWECNPPTGIRFLQFNKQFIVIFEKYTVEGKILRLEPCTILLLPDDLQAYYDEEAMQNKIRQSVVFRTQQFAEIEFDGNVDISKMPLPTPQTGRLWGKVTIESNMADSSTQDDFYLETEEGIEIREAPGLTTIETLKDVRFKFGPHYGVGTGLTFKITQSDQPQAQAKRELQSAVFRKLRALQLVLSEGPNAGTTIDVHCQDRFEFAANSAEEGWTASFYKGVNMTRNNPDRTADKLTAEDVHLLLKTAKQEEISSKTSQFDNLEPALFIANGKAGQNGQPPIPARLSVKQGGDVTLVGDQIFFDLRTNSLSLSTRQEAGASPFVEMIVADQYHIRSEYCVEYTLGENGAFGKFAAEGKGEMVGKTGEGAAARDIHLTWNEMQMGPHPAMKDQIVLKLSKGVTANMTGFGTMTADTADLCCIYAAEGKQKNNFTLDNLIVKENVQFETDAGTCNVKQLHVFFTNLTPDGKIIYSRWIPQMLLEQPPATPGKAMAVAQQPILQVQHLQPLTPQTMQPVPLYSPPAAAVAAPVYNNNRLPNPQSTAAPKNSVETQNLLGMKSPGGGRFEMTGDTMKMNIIVQNGQSLAEKVAIEGNVRLKENIAGHVPNTAVEMTGDTVTIWNPADPATKICIMGQPTGSDAVFKGKGIELRAKEVNLSRPDNMFWVPGAGRLIADTGQVSMSGIPSENAKGNELTVDWNEAMKCDGKVLQFIGKPDRTGNRVRTKYQTQSFDVSMWCNEMEIHLNRHVMFFDDQSSVEPKAVKILCVHDVHVQNRQLDAHGKQKSLDKAKFSLLQYDIENSYFYADGPGELTTVFLGSGQGFNPANLTGTPNNLAGAPGNNAEKLQYLAVWFPDTMHGTLLENRRRADMSGRKIQAIFCPAASWDDTVGIENLAAARKAGYTMECEQLLVEEMPNPLNLSQYAMELTASNPAIVDGSGIWGKAQTIKYNQAKSTLNMDGNITVEITIQGQKSRQDAESLQYNIETKSFDYIRAKGAGIN